MIIDEIICIYEVQKEVEKNPIQDYNTVNREIKRERSLSIESDDSYLQFNMDVRTDYNSIIGNMISENSNY